MSGSRAEWAELLPLIQAFVDGATVQRKDYDNRWKDTTVVHGLLTGSKYRIKPKDIVQGLWTVEFTESEPGSVSGPTKRGTMCWHGSNMDTPPWKWSSYCVKVEGTEKFTPKEEA